MQEMEKFSYRVKNKGGKLAGKNIDVHAPKFDMTQFIKAPNAEEFIKKAYAAAVKKIAREIEEGKNGSVDADLQSYEMIIARSLCFTQADITQWLKSRDWSRISHKKNPDELRKFLENKLPKLAMREPGMEHKNAILIARELIAPLADKPDPIADYLFVVLTVERTETKIKNIDF